MKTSREIKIDAYLKQHEDAKLEGFHSVVIKGEVKRLEIYRLPIDLLIFNIGNGRFASELLAEERKLKRKLDATIEADENIIRRLLLEINPAETKALKEDLIRNGQIDPGVITFDGAVINGNRRMAIFKELYSTTQEDKYTFLNVSRLQKGISEKDLWKIEAKLQFGRDFRLEYGPINELLKIRSGNESGLTPKQISDALLGRYKEKEVVEKLEILKLIDTYLRFIGKPSEYEIIQEQRIVEKFNSLQSSVIGPLKRGVHKKEVPRITEIGFRLIKGGKHSHWKIRKLKSIAETDESRSMLYKAFDRKGKLADSDRLVQDGFDSAEFISDSHEEKDRPEKLAGKALSALRQIDSNHESVSKPDFQKLIKEVQGELVRLKKAGGN